MGRLLIASGGLVSLGVLFFAAGVNPWTAEAATLACAALAVGLLITIIGNLWSLASEVRDLRNRIEKH